MDKQTLLLAQFFEELAEKTLKGNSSFRALSTSGSKNPNKIYYDDKNGKRVGTEYHYPIVFDFEINADGSKTIIPDDRFPDIEFVMSSSTWNNCSILKLLVINRKDDTIVCIDNGRWYTCE